VSAARKYLPLVLGVPGCLAAGWFELTRALAGREVAWVYVFEWPLYALVGAYMWWRIWRPSTRRDGPSSRKRSPDRSHPVDRPAVQVAEADVDLGLEAWQDYLARLHAADPPGGPPDSDGSEQVLQQGVQGDRDEK
jgi:hypothetical protein